MKRTILISLIVGITLIFGSWAMAAPRTAVPLPAPTGLTCTTDGDSVSLGWDDVVGAKKYSVDVEVLISGSWDEGVIVKLSFGTSASDLDVLFTDFVYDFGEGPVQVYGEARAKVKALNPPGKSQNHPFSDPPCEFTIPE